MTAYVHCRPYPGSHISTCPCTFLFVHPDYIITSNYPPFASPTYNHDQVPAVPRRRRRLEDPIITHASNYYATLPHQIPQAPPSPPPPRRVNQRANHDDDFCDLFNLLDRASSPSKQRRKHSGHRPHSRRHHRSIELKTSPGKQVNDANDRQPIHRHQSSSCQAREHPNDGLLSPAQTKKTNEICQRRTANKGFFRRVMHNYFCVPTTTITNNGYSS